MWSVLVWLAATPTVYHYQFEKELPINSAFIVGSLYALYYLVLHPIIGVLALPYVYSIMYLANQFYKTDPKAINIATVAHISSWVFQISGHKIFEGRAPAFTKEPIQGILD